MDDTISSVISISPAFATEVHLKRDFTNLQENIEKLRGYVPTSLSRKALQGILEGLHPASRKRVHLITGSYGAGKSHFGLVLANIVSKSLEDPDIVPFFEKFGDRDPNGLKYVQTVRKSTKPYLVVLPEPHWDPEGFHHSLIIALSEALEREKIQFRPPSHFDAALNCIQNWKQNMPEAYEKITDAFIKREKTIEMVLDGLKDYNDSTYSLFEDAYEQVAYGAMFHPQATAKPTSVYEETAKYLKSTGDWQGIFIFYDEFGSYLTQMARDPDSRGGQQLQEFAEFCKRSGENQCHLVVIAHQTLKDYAKGYRTEEEWTKIYGRFIDSEYPLAVAGTEPETEDMIDSIIIQQKEELWEVISNHGDFNILADLARDTGLYSTKSMSWIESSLVRGCYPVHPFAVFCLPWVSDRVGQRERTVFTFLCRSSEASLRHFVDANKIERSDGRLNLYTVDMLYDYFAEQIRSHPDYRHIVLAADKALGVCGESALAGRIIKTISILSVVAHSSLAPTKKTIGEALHLAPGQQYELDTILTELVNQRVLWHRRATDRYELPSKTGLVDAREAVDKEKKSLLQRGGFDLVGFLNSRYRPQPIVAYEYAQNHFVRRQAACEYITASHLSNPVVFIDRIKRWYQPNRGKYEGDLLVLYIVADSIADIDGVQSYLGKEACKHPQLVIAVPKKPITFTEAALELQAIALLRQAGLTLEEGTIDNEDLNMIEQDSLNSIQEGIAEFRQAHNLTWFCNGNVVANLQKGGEEKFISTILESVFSMTPLVKDDATANPVFTTDKDKKGRQNAMDRILGVKGAFQVQKSAGPAADRILRFCLKNTELLQKVADKASVEEFEVREEAPQNSELDEIWKFMNEKVVAKGGKETEMVEIVQPLLNPPYGLSNQLIEVLLAAFLRNRRDDSTVFSNIQNYKKTGNQDAFTLVQLDGTAITRIVYEPEDYAIVYYEVKPEERQYLQKLVDILGADESLLSTQGLWEGTKSALLDWYEALPLLTKSAQDFEHPSCVPLLDLLDNTEKNRQAKELLQNYLPQVFGLDLTQPDQVLERFHEVYDELNGYSRSKEASLLAKIGTVFNADGSTEIDIATAMRGWYNAVLSETQRLHAFVGDEGRLLQAVRQEASVTENMLHKLPSEMGLGAYTEWEADATEDLFILKIRLAKQNIETWTPPTREEPPEKDLNARASRAEKEIRNLFDELKIPQPVKKAILEKLLKELAP